MERLRFRDRTVVRPMDGGSAHGAFDGGAWWRKESKRGEEKRRCRGRRGEERG
jgi:hypothetical protein